MAEKARYSDEELQEFKELILEKIDKAQREYDTLRASFMNSDGNGVADTSPTFKALEEGAYTLGKEEAWPKGSDSSSRSFRLRSYVSRTRHTASAA